MYQVVGYSKQAFHQKLDRSFRYQAQLGQLRTIIEEFRQEHPGMNCRDMYYVLQPEGIGRDHFEAYCQLNGYGVQLKRNQVRTTDSKGVIRYPNLTQGLEVNRPNQVWSSDITYYRIGEQFYYLTFILDNYTRRILGYQVSRSLHTEETTLPALKQAVKQRTQLNTSDLIFHSDGGGQYYAKQFLLYTKQLQIRNSMCEFAYENGKAERINGVIKNNYLKYWKPSNFQELKEKVDLAVHNYNVTKPHKALNRLSPIQFESEFNKIPLNLRTLNRRTVPINS